MKIANESLFRHSLSDGINLFLGAGFSVSAKADGKLLPIGNALKNEVIDRFKRPKPSSLSLSQICQIVSSTQKDALNEFFKVRFTVTEFAPEYHHLERVAIKSIFTTNIDDLIIKIFAESKKYYINDVLLRGPVISGSTAIDFIALHGNVTHEQGGFDFSPIEIASSFERDKDKWFGYSNRIQQTPTLYWGYRVEDAGVLQTLSKDSQKGRSKAESWIVLREEDAEAIEYYGSMDFQIIISDTLELLNYIGQLPVKKKAGSPKSLIGKNFAEYQIPALAKVPVRSLSEFYLGAEPTWYDVYSGKLYETSHFTTAKNAIAGAKSVVLTGATVSGKTTLLKQLATRVSGFGINLYIDEITPEKATLLLRDIDAEGQQVILFIDNAADASEAIKILVESSNIKIVAAERDYIFDSVAHRFPSSKFNIIDISGLSPVDTQAIQERIPSDVQRKAFEYQDDELNSNADPTFFEVITSTILRNSLVERFIDALEKFKTTSPVSHDLLLAACYCHHCRIPLSVDISTAFCRPHGVSPMAVSEALQNMVNLLSDYEGALAETSQNYYVPRSRQVAEAVLWKIPTTELRRLLELFHDEVSPTKIGRYDVFRRAAYDARLVGRAFPRWEEGLHFYEHAASRDSSYSLKQQGALYLAQKRNFELAFTWIDDARSMTGRNNAAIRNSYAVILFDANYHKESSAEVRDLLNESMSILENCYDQDHRKVYHAKVFAEQAVKYASKFPDSEKAIIYLNLSDQWLAAELQKRVGERRMLQLKRQVATARRNLKRW